MVKRMSIYSLPEGTDPDKFWDYHKNIHAVDALKVFGPALKKYVINRVISSHAVAPELEKQIKFFDIVETWWENEEEMKQAYEKAKTFEVASGKFFLEDWMSQIGWGVAFSVEEIVVKDIT